MEPCYAVTFSISKQRYELNFSISNQPMEYFQMGVIMHVSVSVSGMDLFSFYPGSADRDDKLEKHWLVLGPFQYELSRPCVCVYVCLLYS